MHAAAETGEQARVHEVHEVAAASVSVVGSSGSEGAGGAANPAERKHLGSEVERGRGFFLTRYGLAAAFCTQAGAERAGARGCVQGGNGVLALSGGERPRGRDRVVVSALNWVAQGVQERERARARGCQGRGKKGAASLFRLADGHKRAADGSAHGRAGLRNEAWAAGPRCGGREKLEPACQSSRRTQRDTEVPSLIKNESPKMAAIVGSRNRGTGANEHGLTSGCSP